LESLIARLRFLKTPLIMVSENATMLTIMKAKHRKTITAIFAKPTKANIKFSDIESMIEALGGEVREGNGSRVVLELSGTREYVHRSHPGKEAKKYMIERIREWLTGLGVTP